MSPAALRFPVPRLGFPAVLEAVVIHRPHPRQEAAESSVLMALTMIMTDLLTTRLIPAATAQKTLPNLMMAAVRINHLRPIQAHLPVPAHPAITPWGITACLIPVPEIVNQ